MPTIDTQKAELMRQIEEAKENWESIEYLADEGLKLDPEWFDVATRLQAACSELSYFAALDAVHAARAAQINPSPQNLQRVVDAAVTALARATRMLEANRLVRRLVDAQQQ